MFAHGDALIGIPMDRRAGMPGQGQTEEGGKGDASLAEASGFLVNPLCNRALE
jgi:hypothetical protein